MDYIYKTFLDMIKGALPYKDDDSLKVPIGFKVVSAPSAIEIEYEDMSVDLNRIPNIIVSGTVGSGKTTFVQSLLLSLSNLYNPNQVKFVIFDSKGVDYVGFNGLCFLEVPVVSNVRKAAGALSWLLL